MRRIRTREIRHYTRVLAGLGITVAISSALAACGSGESPAPAAAPSSTAPNATASSQTKSASNSGSASNSTADPRPHGILLLTCDNPSSDDFTLWEVDLRSGSKDQVATWHLGSGQESHFGCGDPTGFGNVTGWELRQMFNSDFTEIAVTENGLPGVVGRDGTVKLLASQPASGYATKSLQALRALFRPGTDQVWYVEGSSAPADNGAKELYSIDATHPGPELASATMSGPSADQFDYSPQFEFSPDGKVVVQQDGQLVNPADTLSIASGGNSLGIGSINSGLALPPNDSTQDFPSVVGPTGCQPEGFDPQEINGESSFLCDGQSGVYNIVINQQEVSGQQLVGPGNSRDSSATLSPDGNTVVFISGSSIYSTPAAGGTPKEVADIGDIGGVSRGDDATWWASIIGWSP